MQTATSKDGSRIAYDRLGSGPPVILVAGALGDRKFDTMQELAKAAGRQLHDDQLRPTRARRLDRGEAVR
jgi:hypothetical protein